MPYPGLDISNRTVLITGGTTGIGRANALGRAQAHKPLQTNTQ